MERGQCPFIRPNTNPVELLRNQMKCVSMELDTIKKDIKYIREMLNHLVAVQAQLFASMENSMSSTNTGK
jgi:hypothetical protein